RINVSLDSVDPKSFQEITRRDGLEKVLRGIEMAKRVGFDRIRINAVSIKGRTESEIVPLAIFCRKHRLELRFIEFMPLDGDGNWLADQVLSGKQVLDLISQEVAPLTRVYRHDPSQPATDYEYPGGERVGFINSVTEPFCESCNRLRMTAEGRLRNCLFANQEWDVRHLVRNGHDDAEIVDLIQACVAAKKLGHGSNNGNFVRPERAMYQIGG
ncbi:MAG: radical SAM protein, partial [Planctomycetota bacterium]